MNKELQKYLLGVARNAIAEELGATAEDLERPDDKVLEEKCGVFVTLEIGGQLRGCIGNIVGVYPLEEGVRKNALNAAFNDPRFEPLGKDEFEDVEIEISVLSVPKNLQYKDAADLLEKLESLRDGVILKKGFYEATYLPQVWEDLPDKERFLSSLCMKAGLMPDEWRNGRLEISTYQAEVF